MAVQHFPDRLIERLPQVRGQLIKNADLAKVTWFRVGGPAEVLFRPADKDDLKTFLYELPREVAVTLLGVGSNTLIRDGGIPGVSIRLGNGFSEIKTEDHLIQAGAGAPNLKIANAARDHGLAGFEFLSGIPGALGGSIRMNAGAFGREIGEMVEMVCGLSRSGDEVQFTREDMAFSYRHTGVGVDVIFTDATLRGQPGDRRSIMRRMTEIQAERERSQPVKQATGGSTFVNPKGAKAWELIDKAGCRGLRRGNALVSEKHCNFLINQGGASAADLEGLGEDVRRRVEDQTGIILEWEIKRIGVYAAAGPQEFVS